MENFGERLEEIKKMLSPSSDAKKSDKTRAYQALFELATAESDSCSLQLLGDSANALVSVVVPDIFDYDEEIGSKALKCLGFMLYHPSIVPKITDHYKSICKLAAWCISVQQFTAATLDAHFHSLLKAIAHALENPIGSLSIRFEAMQVCSFARKLLVMVAQEIDTSILESHQYKMAVNLKCLNELDRDSPCKGIWFVSYMDMVPPIVYLNVLFFSVAMKLTSEDADLNAATDRLYRHVKFCLFSYDTPEVLGLFVGLLLKYEAFDCLIIWRTLVICLKDYIDDKTPSSLFITGAKNPSYSVVLHLLSYPFLHLLRQGKILVEYVLEVWKLLYASVNRIPFSTEEKFTEDLSSILNAYLDHITIMAGNGAEVKDRETKQDTDMLLFIGNIGVCILEQLILRRDGNNETSTSVKSIVKFSSSFLKVAALVQEETTAPVIKPLIIRILETLIQLVSSLNFKEDILAYIETMENPLLEWLSVGDTEDENTACQFLPLLWTEILNSLRRSQPSIKFDSSFLKFQASLLEQTLHHRNFAVSASTINFWNSTYGGNTQLEYPQNLLPFLHKLHINGKINIDDDRKGYSRVYAMLKSCSKRVGLDEEHERSDLQEKNEMHLSSKRKLPELTEHQKEVRRAQQGRGRDCNGHGPGIRTYTSIDFSQVDEEESQESQVFLVGVGGQEQTMGYSFSFMPLYNN